MKRRILLEVDVDDNRHGAMLEVLNSVCGLMKDLQGSEMIRKYGLALLAPGAPESPTYEIPIETMEAPE